MTTAHIRTERTERDHTATVRGIEISKDGVTVAKAIDFDDHFEDMPFL